MWLMLKGKSLPRIFSRNRSFQGPSICLLYKYDVESINHLFIRCHFTKQVWMKLKISFPQALEWVVESINIFLKPWLTCYLSNNPKGLPLSSSWGIQLERHVAIFKNRTPKSSKFYSQSLEILSLSSSSTLVSHFSP